MSTRRPAVALALLLVLALSGSTTPAAVGAAPQPAGRTAALPARLTDAGFWALTTDISEPGGYFRITDNYTSNEPEIGQLFTMLRETGVQGGVYLGVGPEQNFSYIASIRPSMAFILDIRRQALMQHLMFKAVFELAKDRADFISLLFSKPRPEGLDAATPIQKIWDAYALVATDQAAATRHATRVTGHLTRTHGFALTADESAQIESVLQAFVTFGPAISTRGTGGNSADFAALTGGSLDAAGAPRSFLSSEENFLFVKGLHEKNLIVPVTGDFGGPKAVRAIGAYLRKEGGVVSAFYVSNVEQYLFQDGKADAFYANVATLPMNETSVFIRPYSLRRPTSFRNGVWTSQPLCPIGAFIGASLAGRIVGNASALACGG